MSYPYFCGAGSIFAICREEQRGIAYVAGLICADSSRTRGGRAEDAAPDRDRCGAVHGHGRAAVRTSRNQVPYSAPAAHDPIFPPGAKADAVALAWAVME